MTRNTFLIAVLLATLFATSLACPGLAQAYSTTLNIVVINKTDEPMEYYLQQGANRHGTLQSGEGKKLKTEQTAYVGKENEVPYTLSLVYGHDKGATWEMTIINTYAAGPNIIDCKPKLDHANVPFWTYSYKSEKHGVPSLGIVDSMTLTFIVNNR